MAATTNSLYIPSVDGKDLYIAANFKSEDRRSDGYSLMRADGTHNIAKYINTMDYSLERIKLQEVYERVKRRIDFSFLYNGKRYSNKVINVTFKYSCAEWNMAGRNVFVRFGECERDMRFDDCAAVEGGELIGIVTEREVRRPLPPEVLAPYFSYDKETKTYIKVGNPKKLMSTSDIRAYLYENGFMCGGTHYIRYKRSSGSSRVGKCLFIADYLYPAMHRWELCGLKVKDGDKIDLAGLESYISLPLSSIVDTVELYPENILVIDDYESEFTDDIVSIEDRDGSVVACEKTQTIRNSIWDGQGLIDQSAMGGYQDKGMILLRNRFFKCCCFNTNLEKWFKDNGITRVDQLRGRTRAMQLSDIKLITTPSSIKYLKFGSLDQWLDNLDTTFGVVKYDKKTHYFDGRMVQTHYQLLNTLQMTRDEVRNFLQPTLDYMDMLRRDPAVMRNHIKFSLQEIDPESPRPAQTKNDIVYTMLGVTDKFVYTQLYADFKKDVLSSYTKHVKLGHVMVDGNYSTLFGNPMEMLNAVIGRFDGRSLLGVGNVHSKRFAYGRRVLGSRSPHISMNSVWTPWNVASNDIDTYFNLTDEIVCINSIDENTLWILSGSDFDSDTVLLTDNDILIDAAQKNAGMFKTAISNISSSKRDRYYTWMDKADLDIKTSNNLIGDLINLSQELNTAIWHTLHAGGTYDDIRDIYMDVCILNVLSQIEIDKAKREFPINTAKELTTLRTKYEQRDADGRLIKPNFFAAKDRGKGYYDSKAKNYKKHNTTMDYLQECVNSYRYRWSRTEPKPKIIKFSDLINDDDYVRTNVTYTQVRRIIDLVRQSNDDVRHVYASSLSAHDKQTTAAQIKQDLANHIGTIKSTRNTLVYLLKCLDMEKYKDIQKQMFEILFSTPYKSFYGLLRRTAQPIAVLRPSQNGEISLFSCKYERDFDYNDIF